jgi:hypothetical protein
MQRDLKAASTTAHLEKDWRKRFARSGAELVSWQAECPEGESLLRWCLLNGKISESEYLEWASEIYQLPVILSDFFSEPENQTAGRALWEKSQTAFPWSPGFFPVGEWQGVLLVACVEPPPVKLPGPHCFALASARRLNEIWSSLQAPVTTTSPLADSPQVVAPKAAPAQVASPFDDLGPDEPSHIAVDIGSELAPDIPEGLGQWAQSLDSESAAPFDETPTLDSAPDETASDLPEGLSAHSLDLGLDFSSIIEGNPQGLTPEAASMAPTATPATPATPAPQPPAPKEEIVLSQLTKPAKAQTAAAEPEESEHTAPFTPIVHDDDDSAEGRIAAPEDLQSFKKDRTEITRAFDLSALSMLAEQKINPVPTPVAVVDEVTNVGEIPLDQCKTYDEIAVQALITITKTYEHGMVLLFQAGQLRPWKWSDRMQSQSHGRPSPIDLSKRSIFRIAYRTCLPYHGYVVASPENDTFFAEWYNGQLPKHVTLMPMLINNQLIGMIMGLTEGQVGQKSSLRLMESLAHDIAANFKRLRESKKPAQAA